MMGDGSNWMDRKDFKALGKKNPKNKFGAKRNEYKGRSYASKKEAAHARKLDLLKRDGHVKRWDPQSRIDLKVNGHHITRYYIDFEVEFADGSVELHEVKGEETELWKVKWKLAKALYPDRIFVLIK